MDLRFSQEQLMLQDSVARFVAQRYDHRVRKTIANSPHRIDESIWQAMADFGWLATAIPEEDGGMGGSAVDIGILMEGLGKALVLEPVCTSAVLCSRLIAAVGDEMQRERWLPRMAAGSLRVALAHGGTTMDPYQLSSKTFDVRATRTSSGWRLEGRKSLVLDAPMADLLLVSAQMLDQDGRIALFTVSKDVAGLRFNACDTVDGRRAAALVFDGVSVSEDDLLGGELSCTESLERALDAAVTASCSEVVGAMQSMLDATVEYTKTRAQFGRPLASNQVLAHRMVDMAVQCEEARAITLRAALFCDAEGNDVDARQRARAVSGAKVKVATAARFVAENAVQLHGAMGVTDELDIGAYFKRVLAFEMSWGTCAVHLERSLRLRQNGTE